MSLRLDRCLSNTQTWSQEHDTDSADSIGVADGFEQHGNHREDPFLDVNKRMFMGISLTISSTICQSVDYFCASSPPRSDKTRREIQHPRADSDGERDGIKGVD